MGRLLSQMHHVVTPLNPTAPLDLNLQRFKELRAEGSRRPTAAHKLIYLERPLKHEALHQSPNLTPLPQHSTSAHLQQSLSSRAVECDNGVCFLSIKRHYHTK
ncbi:hypothetical protein AMECASPLE_037450 [Ameca splendens]|uniref:Uncharacterized protein n=1 Tax=Ameca splendens TaxID=208324 RepID=A0ABV0XL02_9TELE